MEDEKFIEIYKKLNKGQKEAVDTVDGPVIVVAGPGTGKTQILTLRIANILRQTDTSPENILALTFTESGVYSMRKRLFDIAGNLAYRVNIFTFHGFCNFLIGKHPEMFPSIIGATNIADLERIDSIEQIIDNSEVTKLKPFGDKFYYARSILDIISQLKRENIGPQKLKDIVIDQEKYFNSIDDIFHTSGAHKGKMKSKYIDLRGSIEKNKELCFVYEKYQNHLRESRFYDYEDMIMETVKAMETTPDFLLSLQENYQYILADEHQDANNAQNKILELLSNFHQSPNLFIVGDEKQAIFTFQGASLDNFLYFQKLYQDAKVIFLEDNYRSTQQILDASHSLISKTTTYDHNDVAIAIRRSLRANSKEPNSSKINVLAFSNQNFEHQFLVSDIKRKIDDGISPGSFAILFRDNKDALPIAKVLEQNGLPYLIESDQDILEDHNIRKLILILKTVINLGNDELFVQMLHLDFLNIDELAIYKTVSTASGQRKKVLEFIQDRERLIELIGRAESEKIFTVLDNLKQWRKIGENSNLVDFLEVILTQSGFLGSILEDIESIDTIDKVNSFFDSIKNIVLSHPMYRLTDLVKYINALELKKISIKKLRSNKEHSGSIHLMTAHKSKGLEFDYVYIIGTYDGHWGGKRHRQHFKIPFRDLEPGSEDNNDERRLFYVAMTRAKKEVNISYSKVDTDSKEKLPSMFIAEVDKHLVEFVDTSSLEIKFKSSLESLLIPKKRKVNKDEHQKVLNQIFISRGLSITALNNYISCPWKYFYINLLRVPKAPTKEALYGIAVHDALRKMFDALREGVSCIKTDLLKNFESNLISQPIAENDLKESLAKGNKALSGYYDCYEKSWETSTVNEFQVSDINFYKDIRLTGKLDKIEIINGGPMVNVVDYKTGKPKTKSEIDGKTKDSTGDYKRQLVFYQLLLNQMKNPKYKMVSGEIDFIEPDSKGEYKKEKFIIDESEIESLVATIKKVVDEILDLSFWNLSCQDKHCQYCQLRKCT